MKAPLLIYSIIYISAHSKLGPAGTSTFEDLLQSLKQLEEDPHNEPLLLSGATGKYGSWLGMYTTLIKYSRLRMTKTNLSRFRM